MNIFKKTIDISNLPLPSDQDRLKLCLEMLNEEAERSDDKDIAAFIKNIQSDKIGMSLLKAIFGNSPFLSRLFIREIAFLKQVIANNTQENIDKLVLETKNALKNEKDLEEVMKKLRLFKQRAALLIGIADICNIASVEQVTKDLSLVAKTALSVACGFLLRKAADKKLIRLKDPSNPELDSGLIVLGMGKLGADELNYSSDIDLIVLYDGNKVDYIGDGDMKNMFIRMTKDLIRIMEERTKDGYVFRTDLRLRPDPNATPIAISTRAAEIYYESFGQNWERAAMIKANPVAGDIKAGLDFLEYLRPFIWRKSLDFIAIQDIKSIKRQINTKKGGSFETKLMGHNIKLGRGGIREIEFFAQTQQLIWGGKKPELRKNKTIDAIEALSKAGYVRQNIAKQMCNSYRFLRKIEHRLQMIDDAQTHKIPNDDEQLRKAALFSGYEDKDSFSGELIFNLENVQYHYNHLFEEEPSLAEQGNLVFTGTEPDPETINTIEEMGFSDPNMIAKTVMDWHRGRCRATRSVRARELLTELIPTLLKALSNTAQPDQAFIRFDEFLSKLPASIQLFSMFYSRPALLDLVAEIMGNSHRLAKQLAKKANLLENVLAPDFFNSIPDKESLRKELDKHLKESSSFEDSLDICRKWGNDRIFQIGVQLLKNIIDANEAGTALSTIADIALSEIYPHVEKEFSKTHGIVEGAELAVIALGKMGSKEMTFQSDLDLVFVYDVPKDINSSNGKRPLSPPAYFGRLIPRYVNAITAPTSEGKLWEIDMRLRPSGSSGPVAVSFEAFEKYQLNEAWTWEHQALTRARVVCGSKKLGKKIEKTIRKILTSKRDAEKLVIDVENMRKRLDKEKHTSDMWNIKHIRGGLVDIEFITQKLILEHGNKHPEIIIPNTGEALMAIGKAGIVSPDLSMKLQAAFSMFQNVHMLLRQSTEGNFSEEKAPLGLKQKLALAAGAKDFDDLKKKMLIYMDSVTDAYFEIITTPAGIAEEAIS